MREVSSISIEELCNDTWEGLYRFVYYKVQNREEAEDITQETYVKAISYLNRSGIEVLEYKSYLRAVALNIIRDRWRDNKRRGKTVNIDDINPEWMASGDFTDSYGDRSLIKRAMEMLKGDQRTVINLRIIEGFSVRETARLMRKKESTVRVLQYRALKALAKLLKEME